MHPTSDNMNEQEIQIKNLCKKVEETAAMAVVKSKDFERLAIKIFDRTGTLLSPTTLKRIWGYLKESTVTRKSTLDLLAQYCGWHNFDEFITGYSPEIESGYVDTEVLNARTDLKKGCIVKLMWNPARICIVKYLGDCKWKIMKSESTHLKPGDTFRSSVFMSGEPLYLEDLVHEGVSSGIYVCGRRNGIRFAVIDNPNDSSATPPPIEWPQHPDIQYRNETSGVIHHKSELHRMFRYRQYFTRMIASHSYLLINFVSGCL